jgi:hypothetical protein
MKVTNHALDHFTLYWTTKRPGIGAGAIAKRAVVAGIIPSNTAISQMRECVERLRTALLILPGNSYKLYPDYTIMELHDLPETLRILGWSYTLSGHGDGRENSVTYLFIRGDERLQASAHTEAEALAKIRLQIATK